MTVEDVCVQVSGDAPSMIDAHPAIEMGTFCDLTHRDFR